MKIKQLTMVAGLSLVLSSCYFNSTGHIFDAASHNAAVKLSDMQVGQAIWYDGSNYYTYLPRYRYDTEVITQYSAGGLRDSDGRKNLTHTQEQQFVKISPELAAYLQGSGNTPPPYSTMEPADEAVKETCSTTYTATRGVPDETLREYRYRSSAAPWLYTAGVFNWLCVDLPITCVENSLALPFVLLTGQTPADLIAGKNLRDAARNGDAAEVRRLLADGCDVNLVDKDGWTPLMHAAYKGQLHICELLVNSGASIHMVSKPGDMTNHFSMNALHLAAYAGHTSCCLYLIQQGINRNATNSVGDTALDVARQQGQYSCADALQAAGCTSSGRSSSSVSSSGYSSGSSWGSSSSSYDWEAESRERMRYQQLENQQVWDDQARGVVP